MQSQFRLINLRAQGDFVTRLVALFLVAISLANWVVIIVKVIAITRYKKTHQKCERFLAQRRFCNQRGRARPTNRPPVSPACYGRPRGHRPSSQHQPAIA